MRKIYTIGETVLDIIFKNGEPVASKAGGSMLNTAMSLGRLGMPINFISEYGIDAVGKIINESLIDNGVNTHYTYKYSEGKSALALAFLDANNNADYSFYKQYPNERMKITFPEVNEDDIIIFGSFYALMREIRNSLIKFLTHAKERNALILYDPNFRKSHLHELLDLIPFITRNITFASIIRSSDEDFSLIYNINDSELAYDKIKSSCKVLIYTANQRGVWIYTPDFYKQYPVQKIQPLSTIGAGDTFNAGIVYSFIKHGITHKEISHLSESQWDKIIPTAIQFATHVCLSYDNYISHEFAAEFKLS